MIARLWDSHRFAVLGFVVALCALGYFGARTITSTFYWMDPAHQEQDIAGWMTPRYIGQSYNLPREVVMEALMMDPNAPPRRISIREIAETNAISMDDLQARVDAAAAAFAAERAARDHGAPAHAD